jgi:hypothetical protein
VATVKKFGRNTTTSTKASPTKTKHTMQGRQRPLIMKVIGQIEDILMRAANFLAILMSRLIGPHCRFMPVSTKSENKKERHSKCSYLYTSDLENYAVAEQMKSKKQKHTHFIH